MEKPLKLPQMQLSELCQRRGWPPPKYLDLVPDKHLRDIGSATISEADMKSHPLYKTKRCQFQELKWANGGCAKGESCPFAHTEVRDFCARASIVVYTYTTMYDSNLSLLIYLSQEELRDQPELPEQHFLYEVQMRRSVSEEEPFAKFRGQDVKPLMAEAKADVARECLEILSPAVSKKEIPTEKELIALCRKAVRYYPTLVELAGNGDWDRWLSSFGAILGSVDPGLCATVKAVHSSTRAFAMKHARALGFTRMRIESNSTDEPLTLTTWLVSNKIPMGDYDARWTDAGPLPAIMRHFETQKLWCPKELSQILQAEPSFDRTVKTFKLLQYLKNFPNIFEVVGEVPHQHIRLLRDESVDSFSNADFPPFPEAALGPSTTTVAPALAGDAAAPTPASQGLISLLTSLNLLDHSDTLGANEVDIEDIPLLGNDDFRAMGMPAEAAEKLTRALEEADDLKPAAHPEPDVLPLPPVDDTVAATAQDISSFLERLGLEKCLPALTKEDVDMNVLQLIKSDQLESSLEKIGLSLGARVKITHGLTTFSSMGVRNDLSQRGVPREFECPITNDIMNDPVVASDGHSYERTAIQQWIARNPASPVTNEPLSSCELISNHNLRSQIQKVRAVCSAGR